MSKKKKNDIELILIIFCSMINTTTFIMQILVKKVSIIFERKLYTCIYILREGVIVGNEQVQRVFNS